MKNPCDICILKVTCTALCDEKTNYRALVGHAVKENIIHPKTGIPGSTNFVKYCQKRNIDEVETMQITIRKFNKEGDKDDPISRQVRKSLRDAQSTKRQKHYKSNL